MVSVMTGGIIDENGQYYTSVQSGVPGNPDASQRLYGVTVDVATGKVIEENVLVNQIREYELY